MKMMRKHGEALNTMHDLSQHLAFQGKQLDKMMQIQLMALQGKQPGQIMQVCAHPLHRAATTSF